MFHQENRSNYTFAERVWCKSSISDPLDLLSWPKLLRLQLLLQLSSHKMKSYDIHYNAWQCNQVPSLRLEVYVYILFSNHLN